MKHMSHKLNKEILELVLDLIKKPNHVRALAEKVKEPVATIQRKLIKLKESNVVDFEFIGRNKNYFLKKNLIAQKYIYNAENYKILKLIEKYPNLGQIFFEILKITKNEILILFGSYAKFNAKKTSDIDIYVDTKDKNLKKEIELINSKINVKIGIFDKKSLLIQEIIKNHGIIKGVEEYYDKIEFFK